MPEVSARRIAILLIVPLALLGAAIVYTPLPRGAAGDTRCLPIVGPRMRIDTALTGDERLLTIAHESEHAEQCRRDGALRNYFRRIRRAGRLDAELGAYCAEGRAEVALGHPANRVVTRILDELESGYPWFRQTPRAEFLRLLSGRCPELVAPAPT